MGGAKESRAVARRMPTKHRNLMPFHLPSAVLNHDRDLLLLGPLHRSVSNDVQIQHQTGPCLLNVNHRNDGNKQTHL